jgi:hypothetical protein
MPAQTRVRAEWSNACETRCYAFRVRVALLVVLACTFGCAEGVTPIDLGEDEPKPVAESDAGRADASRPTSAPDAGTKAAADAGAPDGGVTTADCKGTSSCPVPIVSGTTSGWYSIRVTENDSGVSGRKLKLKVTLTSPVSSNFDLYWYDQAPADCTTVWQSSTQSSGVDTAAASWGEGSIANGNADDKDVYIEVRHAGGACNASATWSMQIEGNN